MTTKFEVGIDWRRKGFICWDARPDDPLNMLPNAQMIDGFHRWVFDGTGSGGVHTLVGAPSEHGTLAFRVTSPNAGGRLALVVGENGFAGPLQFVVSPLTTYRASVWVRGNSGYSTYNFSFEARNSGRHIMLMASEAKPLTAAWQRFSVTFTTEATDTRVFLELALVAHDANASFDLTGFMLHPGNQNLGFNVGNSVDLYDNLTDRVTDAEWFLGIHAPYQDDADNSRLELKLNNADRRYSPENESSLLAGKLMPYRPVGIRSNDGTTTRKHWSGWVESIQPSVNQYGEREATLKAAGAMLFFEDVETALPVQENRRTDQIIADLLREVPVAPALLASTLLDVAGYAELGLTTFLPDPVIAYDLNAGQTTLAYAADNWVRPRDPGSDKPESFNVYRAIKDVVAAERGRFFFDREGKAIFWDRHKLLKRKLEGTDPVFEDTMQGLNYEFAGLGEFKNDITVTCHPRAIGDGENDLLWSLDQPITVRAGDTRKMTVSYKDESENRIGGKNVKLANVTFSEGSGSVRLTAGGNRAILEIINDSPSQNAPSSQGQITLATCELRGTKITDFGTMDATARDQVSINLYGRRALRMNLPSIDQLGDAQSIADFEKARRALPSGKVKTMTLASHATLGGNQHDEQLKRTIGDLIRVKETQTAHDDVYFIIGEEHRLAERGERYETIWYLEPAADSNWFVINTSNLDQAVLAY